MSETYCWVYIVIVYVGLKIQIGLFCEKKTRATINPPKKKEMEKLGKVKVVFVSSFFLSPVPLNTSTTNSVQHFSCQTCKGLNEL